MKLFNSIADKKKISKKELLVNPASALVCAELDDSCRKDFPHTRCVTDEEMALFLEKRSGHSSYEGIVSHISSCSRCATLACRTFRAAEAKKVRAPKGSIEISFDLALAGKKPTVQSVLSAAFFFTAIAALVMTAVATVMLAMK